MLSPPWAQLFWNSLKNTCCFLSFCIMCMAHQNKSSSYNLIIWGRSAEHLFVWPLSQSIWILIYLFNQRSNELNYTVFIRATKGGKGIEMELEKRLLSAGFWQGLKSVSDYRPFLLQKAAEVYRGSLKLNEAWQTCQSSGGFLWQGRNFARFHAFYLPNTGHKLPTSLQKEKKNTFWGKKGKIMMVGQEWQMIVHLFKIQKVNLRRKEEEWKKMSAKAPLWAECRANMSGNVRADIRKQRKINSNNNNGASLHILLLLLSIIPFHLTQHHNPSLLPFVSGWGLLFQPLLILTLIREEQTLHNWELKQLPYRRESTASTGRAAQALKRVKIETEVEEKRSVLW